MPAPPDYYRALNVAENADTATIRKAYKKLALKWHPDKNRQNPKVAEEKFKGIAEAYQVLSDDAERRKYDRARNAPPSPEGGGGGFEWDGSDPFATRYAEGFNPTNRSHFDQQRQQNRNRNRAQPRSRRGQASDFPSTPFMRPNVDLNDAEAIFRNFFGGKDPFAVFSTQKASDRIIVRTRVSGSGFVEDDTSDTYSVASGYGDGGGSGGGFDNFSSMDSFGAFGAGFGNQNNPPQLGMGSSFDNNFGFGGTPRRQQSADGWGGQSLGQVLGVDDRRGAGRTRSTSRSTTGSRYGGGQLALGSSTGTGTGRSGRSRHSGSSGSSGAGRMLALPSSSGSSGRQLCTGGRRTGTSASSFGNGLADTNGDEELALRFADVENAAW